MPQGRKPKEAKARPNRRPWTYGLEMAQELQARHPDAFRNVPPFSDILFVLDQDARPKRGGKALRVKVSKITPGLVDFLSTAATWMVECFHQHVMTYDTRQMRALMAHALFHFGYHDKTGLHFIKQPDIQEFTPMLRSLGENWRATHGTVPDILDPAFNWKGLPIQADLFSRPTAPKAAAQRPVANEQVAGAASDPGEGNGRSAPRAPASGTSQRHRPAPPAPPAASEVPPPA